MTDARLVVTIRSWIDSLTVMQELIVLTGVVLFFAGLALSAPFWKILVLILAVSAIAYVAVSVWQKKTETAGSQDEPGEEDTASEAQQYGPTDHETGHAVGKPYRIDFQPASSEQLTETKQAQVTGDSSTPAAGFRQQRREYQLSDFFGTDEDKGQPDDGPRAEFNILVKKLLAVIKEVNFANTVALYWVNREKHQLVLEDYATSSSQFTTHRRRELGSDVVSQVATSGQPQMLGRVNTLSQTELLPYYEGTEPVKTFVGVPIFYSRLSGGVNEPVAVLAIDCLEEDAYGPETLSLLAQFTKLISSLIQSYTDKYDLLLDSEVLRSITRFRDQLRTDFGNHTVVRSLAEETSRLLPWDYISVVVFDEGRKAWIVQYVMNRMNDPYVPLMSVVDPNQSVVGGVIQSGVAKIVDRVSALQTPRFYQAERCESNGSMLAMPLNSLSRCYGALVVENKDPGTYSDADVKLIQKIAETSSWALEILNQAEVMKNYVSLDETTGVATRKFFMERLQEEVQRACDFSADVAVVMISIDAMNEHLSRYGREAFDFVLQNVGRMVRTSIRPYDMIGRYDFNRFAVLLVNTTPNEASLWAEKLRKNVASNIINLENMSFSVTISVGVSGSTGEANDVELLDHADRVLRRAVEAGGNIVRVF